MTIADWANWCMVIEAIGAIIVFPIVGAFWGQHRKIQALKKEVHDLERELHRPNNRRESK